MLRNLGTTDIKITPVAMGCWPIAGMTSLDVNDADSLATLEAAVDAGINFFDTAYCYGAHGESEKLIARALGQRRDEIVIATKGGLHWLPDGTRPYDARPERIILECNESLQRLNTDRVELLYLHAPDPKVPVAESAAGFKQLLEAGKTRSVGISNLSLAQMKEFHAVCPITACQPPYNMLMREIEADIVPWCLANQVSICIYWPLMKGLLTGKLPRDIVFQKGDGRAKYPMFQGEEYQKNQDLLDRLRVIAEEAGHTVTELVVNWTIQQPGITAALCGAKRPQQIRESAGGMGWELSAAQMSAIDAALQLRGQPVTLPAV